MARGRTGTRRLRASYVTSVISISLVLFMLGLLGLIVIYGQKLSVNVRENLTVSVMLNENVPDSSIAEFRSNLIRSGYVKSTKYISREQAAKELSSELGEDFVQFLGYNPLSASIDMQMVSEYANNDSIAMIQKKLLADNTIVKDVVYQKSLIDEVNANIQRISLILLGFSIILLVVSILLISNTIRLSIYSRRFLIRSMQLVGATESFIRRPFIKRSMLHGIIAAFVAIFMLTLLIVFMANKFSEINALHDEMLYAVLFLSLLLIGIIISGAATIISVNKFLKMRLDKLYAH